MAGDWKDMLGALRAGMNDAGEPEESHPQEIVATAPVQSARLDIVFERKGRGGKTATIICGFTIGDEAIEELAAELKRRLGTGGSVRGGEILVQGDRREAVLRFLTSKGFKARII